jgi:hypothetical protein
MRTFQPGPSIFQIGDRVDAANEEFSKQRHLRDEGQKLLTGDGKL